jgi:hypothetical protein
MELEAEPRCLVSSAAGTYRSRKQEHALMRLCLTLHIGTTAVFVMRPQLFI